MLAVANCSHQAPLRQRSTTGAFSELLDDASPGDSGWDDELGLGGGRGDRDGEEGGLPARPTREVFEEAMAALSPELRKLWVLFSPPPFFFFSNFRLFFA